MKKGCYVSVGRCPTAGLRCRVGRFWTSATGSQHPSRRRDAGAVRRLRGQLASAPHNPVSPRRRLWRSSPVGSALRRPNRQVRTKGGTRLGRLDRKARRKPPWHRRCHQGSRLPPRSALNGAHRAPAPLPAFFRESWAKNFTRLRRARALVVRTDAAFSRRPLARIVPRGHAPRIAWGATPANREPRHWANFTLVLLFLVR